jgi:hypothetical protein
VRDAKAEAAVEGGRHCWTGPPHDVTSASSSVPPTRPSRPSE